MRCDAEEEEEDEEDEVDEGEVCTTIRMNGTNFYIFKFSRVQ